MDELARPSMAKRGRPSPVDSTFEKHRSTITRLYYTEDCKLPDVIQFMKTRHGFSATTKQYKGRLKAWALWKNIRKSEMISLARIKMHRDVICKSTRFKRHGKNVEVAKIDRWIKRNKKAMGEGDFHALMQRKESTPCDITYETEDEESVLLPESPMSQLAGSHLSNHTRRNSIGQDNLPSAQMISFSFTPIQVPLDLPTQRNLRAMLCSIRDWFTGDMDSGVRFVSDTAQYCTAQGSSMKPNRHENHEWDDVMLLGEHLFARGYNALAGKAIRKSFLMLEKVIADRHFTRPRQILGVVEVMVSREQWSLIRIFFAHFIAFSKVLRLPSSHPIVRLISLMDGVICMWHDSKAELERLAQYTKDSSEKYIQERIGNLRARPYLLSGSYTERVRDLQVEPLEALQDEIIDKEREITGDGDCRDMVKALTWTRETLAEAEALRQRWDAAATHMQDAVRRRKLLSGCENPRVIRGLFATEEWFTKSKIPHEAAKAGLEAFQLAEAYFKDILDPFSSKYSA